MSDRSAATRDKDTMIAMLTRNLRAPGNITPFVLRDALYSAWDNTVSAASSGLVTGSEAAATANREAINALIDTLSSAGGGVVYLPAGVYYFDGTGTASDGAILLKDNITLRGDGMGATILRAVDTVDDKLTGIVRTPSGVENANITIMDLTIDGGSQTGNGDVTVFYAGVTPASADTDTDINLIRVEAMNGYNGTDSAGYGFDPHEVVTRISFVDCYAHDNDQDGFILDGCVDFSLRGCKSIDNGRHGYNFVTGTRQGDVIGCIARGNGVGASGGNGLVIQNDARSITVSGGIFDDSVDENIRIRGNGTITETNVTITDCHISNGQSDGLRITGAKNNVIRDCYFVDNGLGANNTHDDIQFDNDGVEEGGANYVLNNVILALAGGNATRYAVREETDGGDANIIEGNVCIGQVNSTAVSISASSGSIAQTIQGNNIRMTASNTSPVVFQVNRTGTTWIDVFSVDTSTGAITFPNSALAAAAGDVTVAATPTYYVAGSANVEAHLAGIDAELGALGGEIDGLDDSGVAAAASATNYTPAGPTVEGHLSGIDSALGSVSASITQRVYRNYTVGDTWTKPAGLYAVIAEGLGGGGAGGGNTATSSGSSSSGGGGAAGAPGRKFILAADLGATETVTVGSGGVGVSANDGGDGTLSSFGAHLSCPGGGGGFVGNNGSNFSGRAGGAGATSTGSDLPGGGMSGFPGIRSGSVGIGGNGGSSKYGGGGAGIANGGSTSASGAASGLGAGGSGSSTGTAGVAGPGANGTGGMISVEEIYL